MLKSFVPTANRAAVWRVELLGQVRALCGDAVITQFGSRKVAALLARLALYPQRIHSREELIDLLWPEADLDTGRNRLRQALSTLRRLLEPPGFPALLLTDRSSLRLNPDGFSCDANEFKAHLQTRNVQAARELYCGELLPGFFDDWIVEERRQLAALAEALELQAPEAGRPAPRLHAQASEATSAAASVTTGAVLLPAYVARFFGREADIAQVTQCLAAHRLVTLLGPGGSGKTRLSVEVARQVARGLVPASLVAFVALAECVRPDELPGRIRAALQLQNLSASPASGDAPDDPLDPLRMFLQGRDVLLVIDNFEQLVAPGGGQVLQALLHSLPELRLLVSSRRRLELEGERSVELGALPLPQEGDDLSECSANPAVALFVDRAQAVRPGFQLKPGNRAHVEALCRGLEGVPLAIELAASRAHSLSLSEMRAQMQQRFVLLTRQSVRTGRAARHASLDAAIDWSWQLLPPDQQQRLAALSVFRGGWTVDAAAAVWQLDEPGDDTQAITHARLGDLVSDSLVRAEVPANESGDPDAASSEAPMRYHLFEMVREFVAQRLPQAAARAARERHRTWCLALAHAHPALLPLDEVPNLLQALRSALDDGVPQQTLALALATESHWERRGVSPEVRGLWRDALAQVGAQGDTPELHAARRLFARRLYEAGDTATAVALADAAVDAAGDDPALLAPALALRWRIRWKAAPRSDGGASDALRHALTLADAVGDRATRAELLNLLGEVLVLAHNDALAAMAVYAESLALYEALGDTRRRWDVRMGQGICAQVLRRYDEAIAIHHEVAQAARALDDQLLLTDAHNNLAVACNHARQWERAVHFGREQVRLATQQYSHYMQVLALWNLARPLARSRQPEAAALMIAFSAHEWQAHFGTMGAHDWKYVAKLKRLVTAQCGAARATSLWRAGEAMSLAEAVRVALGGAVTSTPAPTR